MTAIAHPARPSSRRHRPTLRLVEPTCGRRRQRRVTSQAASVPPSVSSSPKPLPVATYRRRRALAVAAASFALVLALAGLRLGVQGLATGADHDAGPPAGVVDAIPIGQQLVVVQPGDTMWSIARRLDPTGDPRATVDRLIAANGTAALQPGQRVLLPEG
jgi:hypothetical protein